MVTGSVRTFVPDHWSALDHFRNFYVGTHAFNRHTKKVLAGVGNHLEKAEVLHKLARKFEPNLARDEYELQTMGYTAAANAKEFSAVVEAIYTELYSSIDCARKILGTIYRQIRGIPDSTRKLFQKVKANQLGPGFPQELSQTIAAADWYEELLVIRDELTHADVGTCRRDAENKTITYTHSGILSGGKSLTVNDVMSKLAVLTESIRVFLEKIFHYLNTQLEPVSIDQLCGIFYGRGYMRKLPLEMPITFDSGSCMSHSWFDQEVGYRCPFADNCGAYARARSFNKSTVQHIE
jgi:hypothetical protein